MKQLQRFSKTLLLSTLFTLGAMSSSITQAKHFYKWVDSKGSTHYTNTPPPGNARSKSKVSTYGYRGGSAPVAPQNAQPANVPQNNQAVAPVANQPATAPVANQPTVATNTAHNNQPQSTNHVEQAKPQSQPSVVQK